MRLRLGVGLLATLMAAQSCAAPEVSRRPLARPVDAAAGLGFLAASLPHAAMGAVASSLRPALRPEAQPARFSSGAVPGLGGPICGSASIQGEPMASIPGKLDGCGLDHPVTVAAVGGVRLSQPAVMDCGTAQALETWVEDGVKPALGRRGGGLAELQVAAHYVCRTRNHRPGAKISEHGRGRAIDISALTLANGKSITVEEGWHRRGQRRVMRAIHASACGPFGTVLGPDADRHHQDHFHFDTTPRRSGAYCR